MYQNIFEKGGRLEVFAPKSILNEMLGGEKAKMKYVPTGEYEGGLLCADCDNNVLGGYESYASKTIYAKKDIIPALAPICENWVDPEDATVKWSHCRNIDYKKFKLFLLSILWKSSISSRPFFEEINLGVHEEEIRTMLLRGEPKSVDDYPVTMLSYIPESDALPLVAQPIKRVINDNMTVCQFIVDKFIFVFCVASNKGAFDEAQIEFAIKPNNTMKIRHLPPGTANEFILGHVGV